jgi:hypothetical protein
LANCVFIGGETVGFFDGVTLGGDALILGIEVVTVFVTVGERLAVDGGIVFETAFFVKFSSRLVFITAGAFIFDWVFAPAGGKCSPGEHST